MHGPANRPSPGAIVLPIPVAVFAAFILVTPLVPLRAVAQVRIAGAIAGLVVDNTDAVVPGARVQLKDEGTGIGKESTTNDSGGFLFPDLSFGSYRVTVTLEGFETAVFESVKVESSRTTDLRIKLVVGSVTESVQVKGVVPVLEMTSNIISTTVNNTYLQQLPLNGRSTFAFARLMPGTATPLNSGDTHYNGMPGGTINGTIDGINNASNGFKSGGTSFFATVPPRLGAMEEVTIETAGLGADSGAEGAVNLKFITKRGTNQYHGSVFEQIRNDVFNANSYFNTSRGLPKSKVRQNDFGGNFGGPLPVGPKNKLFFFVNYEEAYVPGTQTRSNTMLTPEAQQGFFRYQTASGEIRTANLLQIAAQNGFQSTLDPTIAQLLAKQNQAIPNGRLASTNDLRTTSFNWLEPGKLLQPYPTARVDFQITPNLSWMGSWNLYGSRDYGRRQWPLADVPVQYLFDLSYWITATGLNWTIGSRNFNEFRYGVQHSGDTTPGRGLEFMTANPSLNGAPIRFAGGAGNLPLGLSPMVQQDAPITGRHYITTIYDALTLLRGNHTFKLGGTYRLTDWHDTSFSGPGGLLGSPAYSIGSAAGDPAANLFTASTMPGVQSPDLGTANALYAFLTGRLTRVLTGRVVDPNTLQYAITNFENWTTSKMGGVYAQDSWRLKPSFTLNYGLRWEFAGAPYNHNDIAVFPDYANLLGPSTGLFQPGRLDGVANPVMTRGMVASKADLMNPAPNVGFAWTPNFDHGLLGKIIGSDSKTVVRGGFARNYYDEGTNFFSSNPGSNPGQQQSLDLRPGVAPGFSPGGLTIQSPLPPYVVFPAAYGNTFNQADFTFSSGFSTMKGNLKTPYVQSWNVGVQREVGAHMVVEARYLGNRGSNLWRTYSLNEVNVFENGFLQEFKNAQNNLAINTANGRTGFANNGLPGQVPLPIFEAAFGARGSQVALSSGSGFTNAGFITNLQQGTAGALASSLASNTQYLCRMIGSPFSPCARLGYDAPGPYPMNFFQVNPYAAGSSLNLVDDNSYSRYNGLQLQLRRRFDRGLSVTANYTLSRATTDLWADNATQSINYHTLRNKSLDDGPSPFDIRHVFQSYLTYDLPFGGDHALRSTNSVVNAVIGGWQLGGVLTLQSGNPFRLSSGRATVNSGDSGVVLAPGVTVDDIQKLIHTNPGPGLNRYFVDPKLIGPDGRANPAYLQVPTEPGKFGQFVYLYGPNNFNVDASFSKEFALPQRARLAIWIGMFNVFNNPVWGLGPTVNNIGLNFLTDANIQSQTFGQTPAPVNNPRSMQVRGGISF
jgi:hypothetical protein